MIPLKLQIKNFLSYGSDLQTIDFGPYPLICLSGKNGHGKSAMLDAITWALWGQARKVSSASKSDDGLMRLGQTQMMVILDFSIDDQVFRVKREYAITYGKPYANLEFGTVSANNSIIPLTDKTIRATQKKIEDTIHIDFDAYVNSAFLRQGNSNEFSKKSPKERKEILATILGLNQYESLRKKALDKIRIATANKQALQTLQDKVLLELENKTAINNDVTTVQDELELLEAHEKNHAEQKQNLQISIEQYAKEQKQHELINFKLEQLSKNEQENQNMFRELVRAWRTTHAQQRMLTDAIELEEKKQNLINNINVHQQSLQQRLEYKEQHLKLQENIQKLQQQFQAQQLENIQQKKVELERLIAQQLHTHAKIDDFEKQQAAHTQELTHLKTNLHKLETQKNKAKNALEQLDSVEKQFERRKEYYQKYSAMGNAIINELDSYKQKGTLVHDEQDPSCPLCEQNLSAARRRFLKQKFAQTELSLNRKRARLAHTVKQLKAILLTQHNQLTALKQEKEKNISCEADINQHIQQQQKLTLAGTKIIHDIQQARAYVIECNKNIDSIKNAIEIMEAAGKKEFLNSTAYQEVMQKMQALQMDINSNNYDAQQHEKTRQELAHIEKKLSTYLHIKKETAQQQQRRKHINDICKKLRIIKQEIQELIIQNNAYEGLERQKLTLVHQKATLEAEIKATQNHKEILLQKKGSLITQQNKLAQLEQEQKKQQKELQLLTEVIDDYYTISTAASKDGIQALLIEDTIPEIEHEANKLLAKLTNNQAQLFIESLRDLKKGGTKETLDIKISDPMGIRPYELFSGGEAFRIDFALRIAISKLLARRAGTALQTLIIDEGFGSQDEDGLNNIMDALYKIQDDFNKIIIVSHLTSMKDQFPVHFVVEKSPNGSKVTIIEQG